jgi:hypothetical protein
MNDDVSGTYLQMGAADPLAEDNARFMAAQQEDQANTFYERVKTSVAGAVGIEDRTKGAGRAFDFLLDTPKNISVGAYRGLVNTIDTAADFAAEAVEANVSTATSRSPALNKGRKDKAGKEVEPVQIPSLSEAYPELMQSVNQIADQWSQSNQLEDDLAEGMTQFALPFMGWLKAMGAANVPKALAAEGITAASAFAPQDGRAADLLQMGRQLDNRFGSFLRKLSPDGSLVNAYIDYMTNRTGEGPWEGRWKNAVDSLVTTGVVAGFLKASGKALRKNRKSIEKKAEKELEASGA